MVAANGDELTGTFSGQAAELEPGVALLTEAATITGGSGRFENATGSFTIERTLTQATGESAGSFVGETNLR